MGRALYLGLTDPKLSKEGILAWRITVRGKEGTVLAEKSSFLWEMPKE
jgi:hypothetical protein